jgi:hypothetical protein
MTTDKQYHILLKMLRKGKMLSAASAKAGVSENTARKFERLKKLPSQCKEERNWRTRTDPFEEAWDEARGILWDTEGAVEAKSLFEELQRKHPGKYSDGQLRTFQRRVKLWRALEGPGKEAYFEQEHRPGELSQSDFTNMSSLGITVAGQPFEHLVYHFVLTYSNWETGTICFSESFESLSTGLQNALWELGGVPAAHQTDRMSAAVHNLSRAKEFTQHYGALMRHYGLEGKKTNAYSAHENGDVEQRHHRFKRAVEQELLLRGSRDFASRKDLEEFYRKLFERLDAGRRERFTQERRALRRLPPRRLEDYTQQRVKVSGGSLISVQRNTYSVHSRLIDEEVTVRLYADVLEVWYAQTRVETLPRLRGEGKHYVQYRHIIDELVRKPGAFTSYRYRADLFPTSYFRMAYDTLKERAPLWADREYLRILQLAAQESQERTEAAIRLLLDEGASISLERVKALVCSDEALGCPQRGRVEEVDLGLYDQLLEAEVG